MNEAATNIENGSQDLSLLSRAEVCERIKVSAWTLNLLVREGRFPAPVKTTGKRTRRWVAQEVDEWVRERMAERDRDAS